jgi:hypothetical protein
VHVTELPCSYIFYCKIPVPHPRRMFMRKAEDMKSGTEIGAGEETVSHAIRESRQEISSTVIRIAEYARLCFSL